jgi:hypothetical protein
MFETAVMHERTGTPWGLIAGLLSFATLIGGAYILLISSI